MLVTRGPWLDATMTRAGRGLRRQVLGDLSHETFRRMLRETYPSTLSRVGPGWLERWGRDVL